MKAGENTPEHSSSLTTVTCRTNGDVTFLRVEGELVDIHLTGTDNLNVVLRSDRPIVGYGDVITLRGVVRLYPKTTTHTHTHYSLFQYVCRAATQHNLMILIIN